VKEIAQSKQLEQSSTNEGDRSGRISKIQTQNQLISKAIEVKKPQSNQL
jgi:hypothetical protein